MKETSSTENEGWKLLMTDFGLAGLHGSLSPDGSLLAFQRWRSRNSVELLVQDIVKGTETSLDIADPTVPRWDAQGRIIYSHPPPDEDLYCCDVIEGTIERITDWGDAWGPCIGPEEVLFASRGIRPGTTLWMRNPQGESEQVSYGWHAAYREDAIYAVQDQDGAMIVRHDLATGEQRNITPGVLPCIDTTALYFCRTGSAIHNSAIWQRNLATDKEQLFLEAPHRHPEIRHVKDRTFMVCEYCPTEKSTIKIAELVRT